MQSLRNAHLLARFVLVWFALFIGAAIASPLVKPQTLEVICTGMGVMKLMVQTDDGAQGVQSSAMDCPLCVLNTAPPPPVTHFVVAPAQPLAYMLQSIPAAHISSLTAAPLPARGPPAFS